MKPSTLFTLFALSVAPAALADTYAIDSNHANARFSIDHFGTSTNHAGFYGLTGTVQFDRAKRSGSVTVEIPVANINSGVAAFDRHLKAADLFHAEKYPTIRFVSDRWHFNPQGQVTAVDGQLTLLGQTHPVRLQAKKFNCYQSPMLKTEVCGGDFTTVIDRTRWGMNYLVAAGVSKDVTIDIQIEAAKQP